MSRFRKQPVEIEARQWDGTAEGATPIIDWALGNNVTINYHCPDGAACKRDTHVLMVSTLEGAITALPGDWIIRGVQGEFYPCKPDIFAQTYTAVSSIGKGIDLLLVEPMTQDKYDASMARHGVIVPRHLFINGTEVLYPLEHPPVLERTEIGSDAAVVTLTLFARSVHISGEVKEPS